MKLRIILVGSVAVLCSICLVVFLVSSTAAQTGPTVSPYLNLLQPDVPGAPQIGRYTIASTHDDLVLCETSTGRCWKLVGEAKQQKQWAFLAPPAPLVK